MDEARLGEIERILDDDERDDGGWDYVAEITLQPQHVRELIAEVRRLRGWTPYIDTDGSTVVDTCPLYGKPTGSAPPS